jgi:hypothetical protein
MTIQASKRSVKDGRIWLPEKGGCSGGYYPLSNPEILTDTLRYYKASGWRSGTVKLRREGDDGSQPTHPQTGEERS